VIEDPWFYLAAVPAVLITGISKGGFGGGLGILAVPMMALVLPAPQAAAIMLPILCLMDLFGLYAYRSSWDARNMAIMLPGGLAGTLIGALTFSLLDPAGVKLLVGLIAVGFTLNYWLRGRLATRPSRTSVIRGGFWSTVAGYTSFVAHAGGPPLSVYLLPQQLDKTIFVGTTVVFFTIVNYVKLVPYAWLGQLGSSNLLAAAVLLPLAPLGMLAGFWLHRRVPEALFYKVTYLLLFVTGLKLVYDGASEA